jgi:hypothetical protein
MSDEYSEEQLHAILATVDAWSEAFAKSPEFARLSDSHQRKAGAITEFFAKYTYEYLVLSPCEWDCAAVEECCTEILPRKVSAETSFFEAIAPVLSAFFTFLEDQSLLGNGRALAEALEDLGDEIVTNAGDRSNWGPAKLFVMTAQEAGVNLRDPGALEAFMLQFNLRQAVRSSFASVVPSSWPLAPEQGPKERESRSPLDRYAPCPCGSGKKYKFCCQRKG